MKNLINLAITSARLRVHHHLRCKYGTSISEYTSLHLEICQELKKLAEGVRQGEKDPRKTALWPLIAQHSTFESFFEQDRPVHFDELDMQSLYASLSKGNCVSYRQWTIHRGPAEEGTDDYGVPIFSRPVLVLVGNLLVSSFPQITKEATREIHSLLTGLPIDRTNDGLGFDFHPAEFGF